MAKGARSNRKKALRTVRREKTAGWQEEAEQKRLAALQQALEAPPAEVHITPPVVVEKPKPMAQEASGQPDVQMGDASASRTKKKGNKLSKLEIVMKRKKQIGHLDKWALEHPKKKRNRGKHKRS